MDGIEARLATIAGLNVSDVTPGQITTPASVVGLPQSINYHSTMGRGKIELTFNVLVATSSAIDVTGQKALASYLDPVGATSVVTAIEGDKTLGGAVDDCIVTGSEVGPLERFGLVDYYGAVFQLRVLSSGV